MSSQLFATEFEGFSVHDALLIFLPYEFVFNYYWILAPESLESWLQCWVLTCSVRKALTNREVKMFSTDILICVSHRYNFFLHLSPLFYRAKSCIFVFPVGNTNQGDRVRKLRMDRYWESHTGSVLVFFLCFLFFPPFLFNKNFKNFIKKKRKKNKLGLLNFCVWAGDLLLWFQANSDQSGQSIWPPRPTCWKEAVWIMESQQKCLQKRAL